MKYIFDTNCKSRQAKYDLRSVVYALSRSRLFIFVTIVSPIHIMFYNQQLIIPLPLYKYIPL